MRFSRIIFDLDGVLYLGHKPIEGAPQALQKIRSSKIPISFLTNNATRSRKSIVQKLGKIGIFAEEEEIMSSAYAAAYYASTLKPKTAFAIGEEGLYEEAKSLKLNLISQEQASKDGAQILLTGLDRKLTYQKLRAGLRVLLKGAKWIACNPDTTYPVQDGIDPGSGSTTGALAYCAGQIGKNAKIRLRMPDFIAGKPSNYMLKLLLAGKIPKNTAFIGDRTDIDMPFANKAGLASILALSGIAKKEDAKKAKGAHKPKYVINSVADLPDFLGL
ncbi:MAG: HAD-IIA family hydrolase [Candidatus Micrarchaeota archaeon]